MTSLTYFKIMPEIKDHAKITYICRSLYVDLPLKINPEDERYTS